MFHTISLSSVFILGVSLANAETLPLPTYDIEQACGAIDNISAQNYCVEHNQSGYDALKTFEWANISEEEKVKCIKYTEGMISPSRHDTASRYPYYYLEQCVNMWLTNEEYKRRQNTQEHFRP